MAAGGAPLRRRARWRSSPGAPGRIALRVALPEGGLIATSIPGPAGWRARAESGELERVRVDGAFLGVRVPAGVERVTLDYRPPGFALGVALGAAALIAVIALAWARSQGARVDGRGARARPLASTAACRRRRRGDRRLSRRQPGARDDRGASSLLAARAVLVPRAQPRALAPRERAGREAASVPRAGRATDPGR